MAFSSQRALSDGTLSDIELTIEYIDRVDLKLFVDSVQIEDTIYSYEFITDNLIRITPDVAAGEEVLIQRQTRLESVLNVFAGGAVFNNASMDENFRQMLLIAQEAREGATLEEIFNDLDLHGYTIRNLADGENAQDAVNRRQLDGVVSAAVSGAAASAAAAASSADLAQRWANAPVDTPVVDGNFSALHWASKAADYAAEASNTMQSGPLSPVGPLFTLDSAIPSWVNRIEVHFLGVLPSETTTIVLQLGTLAAWANAGYNSSARADSSGAFVLANVTNGFGVAISIGSALSGRYEISRCGTSDTWSGAGTGRTATPALHTGAGTTNLGDALTRIRIGVATGTLVSGTVYLTYRR